MFRVVVRKNNIFLNNTAIVVVIKEQINEYAEQLNNF